MKWLCLCHCIYMIPLCNTQLLPVFQTTWHGNRSFHAPHSECISMLFDQIPLTNLRTHHTKLFICHSWISSFTLNMCSVTAIMDGIILYAILNLFELVWLCLTWQFHSTESLVFTVSQMSNNIYTIKCPLLSGLIKSYPCFNNITGVMSLIKGL